MPVFEPVVIDGHKYEMRHVGPRAAVYPTSPASNIALLGRSDLVSRQLPISNLETSPDAAAWTWTGRLDDAGEGQLTFPNKEASDGVPWRQRFDPTGHLQFFELYENGNLDSVCCIDTVNCSQQQVVVHGQDGWFLTKKAYERDWTTILAPRDVIERGTQVWLNVTTDNFPAGSLNPQWTFSQLNGGSESIGPSGGLQLTVPTTVGVQGQAAVASGAISLQFATPVWSATATVQWTSAGSGTTIGSLQIIESDGSQYELNVSPGTATLFNGSLALPATIPTAVSYSVLLESDGAWIRAFVNGQFVGESRRNSATTTTLKTILLTQTGSSGGTGATSEWSAVLTRAQQPLLQRGSDKGDYVLPGGASTYPSGGLAARYFNDTDLQSDANRLLRILGPSRTVAFGGSATAEYADRQDPQIANQDAPAGAAPASGPHYSNWSVVWYGAIYLKLSAGNYSFQMGLPAGFNAAVSVWIGKTQIGQALVSSGAFVNGSVFNFTVTASTLAGNLPYGGGTVQRDGWYPIRVEYAVDSTAGTAPDFTLTNSPAAYTDPGGTAIASGAQSTLVPSTSLSPLGCVDQRFQGISHFDLIQQTVQAYDYQASVEPYRFESLNLSNQAGYFPGQLAPRVMEGQSTDVILKPNTGPRTDGEGITNYSNTLDATDECAELTGNGAGLQNGNTGQLQATAFDPGTILASLFALQGWQDFPDASVLSNLEGLLNSALGLRLAPWEALSADPKGSSRLAFTWPLPGTIARMRWRPGDALRVRARDINIWDTTPRQMLVIARTVAPGGITATSATFANRPRNQARTLNQRFSTANRKQRSNQKQAASLNSGYNLATIGAGATASVAVVQLAPGDRITQIRLAVSGNTGNVPFHVLVNGSDVTAALHGPWTAVPVNLSLKPAATPDASSLLAVSMQNIGGVSSTFNVQLFVDVIR